jgi:HD-GYP domain-containing protein (c-di-GMP phosphodiesterase class II)
MSSTDDNELRQRLQRGRELIVLWNAVLRGVHLYGPGNDTVTAQCERIREASMAVLEADDQVEITSRRDSIFLNGLRIRESALTSGGHRRLIQVLRAAHVGAFTIVDEVTRDELELFARLLGAAAGGGDDPCALTHELSVRGVTSLKIHAATDSEDLPDELTAEQTAKHVYMRAIDVVKTVFLEARSADRISARRVKRAVAAMIESLESDPAALMKLTSLKNYDEYTFNHSVNVSVLAISLGRHVGLKRQQLYTLGQAGMLHDLGKLCIPKEILNKPGRLVPEERQIIESHPLQGFLSIASKLGTSAETIDLALVALKHHVNSDGTGYPTVQATHPKNLLSRIISIVDRYDAMTTDRVYRRGQQPQKALAIMFNSQRAHHDEALLKYFMNLMGYYPLGTTVRLSDGSVGIVTGGSRRPECRSLPTVRIILDPAGKAANDYTIDLAAEAHRENPLRVAEAVDPKPYGIEVMDYIL